MTMKLLRKVLELSLQLRKQPTLKVFFENQKMLNFETCNFLSTFGRFVPLFKDMRSISISHCFCILFDALN